MKKKFAITIAAVLTASMVTSVTAFGAPADIQGHWAQKTIDKWVDRGDISGYPDGTFRPNNMITRAEFVVLVNNVMGYDKTGYTYFSDVPSYYWGRNAIRTGVAEGYISGDGNGKFRPNDPVTREEAAAMIARILDLDENSSRAYRYNDSYAISNWAKGVVGAVSEAGIMAGYPDGSFGPKRVLTRAEAVLALDKTVNYQPGDKEEEEKEDMLLTQTKLEDTTITGDLTISDRLGTKTITLDNVTVKGKLIVDGGGEIILKDCDIKEMVMDQKDTAVKASGKTTVEKTTFQKIGKLSGGDYTDVIVDKELSGSITIDAKVRNLTLDAETDLKLGSDARIKNMEITKNADKATIDFSKGKVEDMTVRDKITIKGSGEIDTMTVYVSDVNTSIRPDTVKTKDGASKPNYTDDDDDWWPSSSYRSITVNDDRSGGTYRNVTVTAGDLTLKNMTIRGNLIIDDDVKKDDIRLENVKVYGHVYVQNSGSSTDIFLTECSLSGNVYTETADHAAILKLDAKTAENLKGSLYVRKEGAQIIGLETKTLPVLQRVVVETDQTVQLEDVTVERVDVTKENRAMEITQGTTVKTLYLSKDAGYSLIDLKGVVEKLQADAPVTVQGNGRILEKSGDVTVGGSVQIAVKEVTLNQKELQMHTGDVITLAATVKPDDATNQNVTWTSSNNDVAAVDGTGKVTAKATGTATITATADGKSATCAVTVNTGTVAVTGVSLNTNKVELSVGEENKLEATVQPDNAANKDVTWRSENESIATVDGSGKVAAKGQGTTNIIVTTVDGGKTATCEVTVKETPVAVTGVGLNTNKVELSVGEENKLEATVQPDNAANKDVTWRSENDAIATVDGSGKVVAKGQGTTNIIVTTVDGGKTATCEVTVKETPVAVTGVGLNTNKVELSVGEENTLVATVQPDHAANKDVTWRSENESIATVDGNGKVVAKGQGTTNIIVTTVDGGKTATCEVTVKETPVAVTGVGLNTNKVELSVGEENKLEATVQPDHAANKDVTWRSENESIATVDGNGKVVAKGQGTTNIIVTTVDGGKTATCEVTVKETPVAVTGVGLNATELKLSAGESNTLVATVQPDHAANKDVTWHSNDETVAKVDASGKVIAQAPGTATITVTTADGGKKATCTVTVVSIQKEKLGALLQEANGLLGTPVSTDGSNIPQNQQWVTQAQKDALQSAVTQAQNVFGQSNADQTSIDQTYRTLQTAVTTFRNSMQPGTQTSFWRFWR